MSWVHNIQQSFQFFHKIKQWTQKLFISIANLCAPLDCESIFHNRVWWYWTIQSVHKKNTKYPHHLTTPCKSVKSMIHFNWFCTIFIVSFNLLIVIIIIIITTISIDRSKLCRTNWFSFVWKASFFLSILSIF